MFFSFSLVLCQERHLILKDSLCVCVFFERGAICGFWNKTCIILLTGSEQIDSMKFLVFIQY